MQSIVRSIQTRLVLVALASFILASSVSAVPPEGPGGNPNPRIAQPNAAVEGLTYGEWSALWWRWALGQPADTNPLLDTTGANCSLGQSGHVWFLAGAFSGTFVRDQCVIPTGTSLFFPVANAFCAAEGSFAQMRACATQFLAGVTYSAEIDGRAVQELGRYRVLSPEFELELPVNNVFGVDPGIYAPAASDGVFLLLNPLSPGLHTIHFTATFAGSEPLDITYHLLVAR